MEIIEIGSDDGELVSGAFDVLRAAHRADAPYVNPPHEGLFAKSIAHPMPDEDAVVLAAVVDGAVAGWMRMGFLNRDNLHFAEADLVVHPERRRRGVGTALLERFIERSRADGRTDLCIAARMPWEDGPVPNDAGRRFLERHGFKPALTSVNRRAEVAAMRPEDEQALLDEAAAAAGEDYEIVSWLGRTPDELVDTMCRLDSMILSEVPLGDLSLEPERIDAELKEAKAARNEAVGIVPVTTVARHRASGEAVANTVIGVIDDPDYADGFQWITIVDPAHRGHRLGTLVKLVNLRLLREQFPQVRRIWTDNADVNAHMIGINAKMGFATVDAVGEYQLKLGS
ncbi:MAG TPA: GNAT family N-acetyltransferase [Glycomyces sp.]|nr:GNAT family N-acetyltransferase [Glycomyces sp.]